MRKQQNVEYEDAPSGNVTFYNYKEPLMRYEEGYGFMGALVFDSETDKLQCHLCGEWEHSLQHHLRKEHNLTASQYKEMVGLNKTSALISETYRSKLIAAGQKRFKNLRKNRKHSEEAKQKISASLKEYRFETKNKIGTCPAQLLERLVVLYNQKGRMPRSREISFYDSLKKVYGSLERACQFAGLPYRKPGQNLEGGRGKTKWTNETVVEAILKFKREHGEFPTVQQMKNVANGSRKLGGWKKVLTEAVVADGKYIQRHHRMKFRYTKPQLLHFLRAFEKVNNRKPSYSDCKRRLLPHLSRYSYNFGSWQNAIKQAFPI